MGQGYIDVCPQLDQPRSSEHYLQPVQVNRNIELVMRNLPPEVKCKQHACSLIFFACISFPSRLVGTTTYVQLITLIYQPCTTMRHL